MAENLNAIREKVKKLLALASCAGATEAEAALAAAKAQELLDEYHLAAADLGDDADESDAAKRHDFPGESGRMPTWRNVLREAVASTCNCFGVRSLQTRTYHLFGKPSDVQLAVELNGFLCEQIERIARGMSGDNGGRDRSWHASFKLGCASRVGQRLRQRYKERLAAADVSHPSRATPDGATRGGALVLYNNRQVAEKIAREAFQCNAPSRPTARRADAFLEGRAAGDRVRLNPEPKIGGSAPLRISHGD